MKIVVLGCKGQLGRCLYDQLSMTDNDVIYTSRDQIDISDFNRTKQNILHFSPDVVINAAAYTEVDKAEEDQATANHINYLSVAHLATCCAELDCWLVHLSTDYVFDGCSSEPYAEEDQANPQSVYGDTKLKGELAIQSSGCKHIIIRTAWVFSEYGNNFLKTMLRLGTERNELRIVGDQVGCPTYAQDIAKAIVVILETVISEGLNSGLYHFSGNSHCSWAEFAESIFYEALALKVITTKPNVVAITTKEFPTQATRPAQSRLNSNKIRSYFKINASDWVLGIRSALFAIKSMHR